MTKEFFSKNPINEIIFRIDTYETTLLDDRKINEISSIISTNTNLINKKIEYEPSFSINLKGNEGNMNFNSIVSSYYFMQEETLEYSNVYLQINKDNIILDLTFDENCKYNDIHDLDNYLESIGKLLQIHNILETRYIGLRYINFIESENKKITQLIQKELLNNNLYLNEYQDSIMRNMSNTEFSLNQYKINIQYGQINSEDINKINENMFILDFDCRAKNLLINNILEKTYSMNDIIYDLFNMSITDEYKKELMEG